MNSTNQSASTHHFTETRLQQKDFIFIQILTLGLYSILWWHANWKTLKQHKLLPKSLQRIPTILLTIASPLLNIYFFRLVSKKAQQYHIASEWDPLLLSILYFLLRSAFYLQIFMVIDNPLYLLLGIFSFLPLIPVQATLYKITEHDSSLNHARIATVKHIIIYFFSFLGWGLLFSYIFIKLLPNTYKASVCIQKGAYNTAHQLLLSEADKGKPSAQKALGKFYATTTTPHINHGIAIVWYHKAAFQEDPSAMFQLAQHYYHGRGTQSHLPKAIAFYHSAANNIPLAKTRLAYFYQYGLGVPANPSKTLTLLQDAAKQGEENAQYMLATHYESGDIVPQNLSLAIYWYKAASKNSMPCAHYALGKHYTQGLGVKANSLKAKYYYRKAAKQFISSSHFPAIATKNNTDIRKIIRYYSKQYVTTTSDQMTMQTITQAIENYCGSGQYLFNWV